MEILLDGSAVGDTTAAVDSELVSRRVPNGSRLDSRGFDDSDEEKCQGRARGDDSIELAVVLVDRRVGEPGRRGELGDDPALHIPDLESR